MKDSFPIFDSTTGNYEHFWAKIRVKLATDPRRINSLFVLKDIFSSAPLLILRRIILILSKPYNQAIDELGVLSDQIRSRHLCPEANVWLDLKLAYLKLTPIECERLRQDCLIEMCKSQ